MTLRTTCPGCQRPLVTGEGPLCRLCTVLATTHPHTVILGCKAGRTTNATRRLRREVTDACDMALGALVRGVAPERVYDELCRRLDGMRWAEKKRAA